MEVQQTTLIELSLPNNLNPEERRTVELELKKVENLPNKEERIVVLNIQASRFEDEVYINKRPESPLSTPSSLISPQFINLYGAENIFTGESLEGIEEFNSIPGAVSDYSFLVTQLMHRALEYQSNTTEENNAVLDKILKIMKNGALDTYTFELYQQLYNKKLKEDEAAAQQTLDYQPNSFQPFSHRPDVVFSSDTNGKPLFKIIETNSEGSDDKGNTEHVMQNTKDYLNATPLGSGIATSYVETVKQRFSQKYPQGMNVATIVPSKYRTEYDPQNEFFAQAANQCAKDAQSNINWYFASVDEVIFNNGKPYIRNSEADLVPIHVIDREFKLPNYSNSVDFSAEKRLIEAHLTGEVDFIGSLLPFSDKAWQAVIFDPTMQDTLIDILKERGEPFDRLARLRGLYAETMLIEASTEENPNIDLTSHGIMPEDTIVLKRTGDNDRTTSSKDIFIISPEHRLTDNNYKKAVKEGGWVIQKFYQPQIHPEIKAYQRYTGQPQSSQDTMLRISPHIIETQLGEWRLAGTLITADINPEEKKRAKRKGQYRPPIVHAGKGTAYLTFARPKV